jgi:phage FluMu gp28-like protein
MTQLADKRLKPTRITEAIGVLLGYQKRWIEDGSQVKLVEKTRRCGFSFAEAADCALLASRENGMDCWYVGYNHDMAKEFIRDCAGWARYYSMAASQIDEGEEVWEEGGEKKSVKTWSITFASGYKITALSSAPANLRGKRGRLVLDEAAFHPDLPELLKAAMAVTMWGGHVHIISTHNGTENHFNHVLTACREGKLGYSVHRITFEDACADGLIERICLVLGEHYSPEVEKAKIAEIRNFYGDDAAEELDCVPSAGGGKYLSVALIQSCMSDATPIIRIKRAPDFELLPISQIEADIAEFCETELGPLLAALPKTARSFFGNDIARYIDLSVFLPLLQDEGLVNRVPFVLEMSNLPFNAQRQILWYILDRLPNLMGGAMDAGGNGSNLAEDTMMRYGAGRIAQIQFSQKWYINHMPKLKAAFEDKSLQGLPRHADVQGDLRTIEMVRGVPQVRERTRSEADKGQKRHGDVAIAAALAIYSTFELNSGPVKVSRPGSKRTGRCHNRAPRRNDITAGYGQ